MTDTPKSTTSSIREQLEDPASHHTSYRLRVTAGPAYDAKTHVDVPVNADKTINFENEHMIVSLAVRIQNYTGFPANSPKTSSYFQDDLHKWDQYSIAFSFIPKKDISGEDFVFGNDFDRPIRDRLPRGFGQALRIVKWWVDPGLDGDPYSDKPYLYGPALSSWNYFRICDKIVSSDTAMSDKDQKWKMPNAESFHETIVHEGAEGSGVEIRDSEYKIPENNAARQKFFLTQANREKFVFEAGRLYQSDFGNGYLNFNDFSLSLPGGFSLKVIGYVDAKTHELRYVLKNRKNGDVYAAVMFTLLYGDELKAYEQEQEGGESNPPLPPRRSGQSPQDEKEEEDSKPNLPPRRANPQEDQVHGESKPTKDDKDIPSVDDDLD